MSRLRVVHLFCILTIAAFSANPSCATDSVTILAQPNVNIGAGFGELTPGPHDLSITFQANGATGYFYAGAYDTSGGTIWNYSSSGSTTATCVSYGATEDRMGWISAFGYNMDYVNFTGYTFGAAFANVTFPCAPSSCDPTNYMSCMGALGCDATKEGQVEVVPGGTATVTATVRHGFAGTLSITGANGDLELLDQDGSPFSSVHVDGAGIHGITITLKASSQFTGPVTLTAKFLNDNGPLDSQDIVTVTKAKVKLDKIILEPSDPPNEGPLTVAVGASVSLRAIPNPAGAQFETNDPSWDFQSKPTTSMISNPTGTDVVSIIPDVEGSYTLRATATTNDTIVISAIEPTLTQFSSQYYVVAAGGKDNSAHQSILTARISPPIAGKVIRFTITSGGQGIDCTGSSLLPTGPDCPIVTVPPRVRAKLTGDGGSYYAGLSTNALEATTGDDGIATVTFTSSNLANDSVTIQSQFRGTSMTASVSALQPTVRHLAMANGSLPRQGSFPAMGELTILRNGQTVYVPGHKVVNYVRRIDFDTLWGGSYDIASPGLFGTYCGTFASITRYASVSGGEQVTTDANGRFEFSVSTYDPDGSNNIKTVTYESRALSAVPDCGTGP